MLVQIDYQLRFNAPFHLGTGVTAGQIDRTVVRDADGYLYVPASTLKGVVREYCEQLCRFYLPNSQIDSPHDAYAALAQFGKAPSLLTRIFGSALYPGGLRFDNAMLEIGDKQLYRGSKDQQTSIATQARIDRETRIAVDKALYTSEFGIRDLIFRGTIKGALTCTPVEVLSGSSQAEEAVPTPTYALLLLLAGLLMVERLGGNKSAGKGQCSCSIIKIVLDQHPCTVDQWEPWIEQLDQALDAYADIEKGGRS